MPQSALGAMLQFLRDRRGLSIRELARLAEIDHAYIYRLEVGDKESPSDDVQAKLIRALKGDRRDADILKYVVEHPTTPVGLVTHVLNDNTIRYDVFSSAAGAVYRGATRPDYDKLITRVRRILDEENDGG